MSERKFHMTFANGLRCIITFDPAIHWNEQTRCARPTKKWLPEPQYKDAEAIFSQYVGWRHTVNSEIAKIVNTAHTCLFTDSYAESPSWSVWRYYPNGKKKCIERGDGLPNPNA